MQIMPAFLSGWEKQQSMWRISEKSDKLHDTPYETKLLQCVILVMVERCPVIFHRIEDALEELQDDILQ